MKLKFLEALMLSHKTENKEDENILDTYIKLGGNGIYAYVEGQYGKSSYGYSHCEGKQVSTKSKLKEPSDYQKKKIKPKLCVCCGAPIHGFKCEYCGVEYE